MYLPKLDWLYFNNMFSNRIIEGATGSSTTGKEYPINIKSNYVTDSNKECSAKCSFSYKYPTSNLTLKNLGTHLELTYDNGRTAPVIFSGEKYNVNKIYILNKSIHWFDNTQSDGEILIYHISSEGAIPLIVCIPLSSQVSSGIGSDSLDKVVTLASNEAPSKDDEITLNTNTIEFTLNDYLPKVGTEFYSYKGNHFIQSSHINSEEVHYIVYHRDNGIHLSSDTDGTANKLNSIITSYDKTFINLDDPSVDDNDDLKEKMFINKYGASEFEGDDDIYIDCSPTGDSDEEVAFKLDANSITGGITAQKYEFMLTVITRFVICIVIILGVWYAPYYVTDLMNGGDIMRAFADMTFGGPMDEIIDLQNQVKKMKQQKIELFSKDENKNQWTSIKQSELDKLIKTLNDKNKEMKQYEGNKAGVPFGKTGFFAEARNEGARMRDERNDQRVKDGTEVGYLTKGMEDGGQWVNNRAAEGIGTPVNEMESWFKGKKKKLI